TLDGNGNCRQRRLLFPRRSTVIVVNDNYISRAAAPRSLSEALPSTEVSDGHRPAGAPSPPPRPARPLRRAGSGQGRHGSQDRPQVPAARQAAQRGATYGPPLADP